MARSPNWPGKGALAQEWGDTSAKETGSVGAGRTACGAVPIVASRLHAAGSAGTNVLCFVKGTSVFWQIL